MATKVLDVEVTEIPVEINGLSPYERALVLFRFRGRPVAQRYLSIANGCISRKQLYDVLMQMDSWPLWQEVLYEFLHWSDVGTKDTAPQLATIAVCTRDRPDYLKRCLDAFMEMPDDGQEFLVIDNCPSTETSRDIVAAYGDRVRYVRENRPGLNVARNRALREATYDLVVFNDDDAVPDPGWLRALLPNFSDPSVLCVTGLTMPLELETEAQEWFERYSPFGRGFTREVYDMVRLHPLAAGRVGAGANMALRRSILDLVGPFNEALDGGTPTYSGGDTEMFSRILAAGYRIVYEPAALSWHRHRRSWKELCQITYGYGVGVYAMWTQKLLYDRELSVPLFAWRWLWYEQLPRFVRSLLRRQDAIPLDLCLAELRGCLTGPPAYLKSRRKLKMRRNN